MAGGDPPFTEWADVVRVAATDTDRKGAASSLADVADNAERHGAATVPTTIHFVPDTIRRLRPKVETDTDDPDEEWPPSRETLERWRAGGSVNQKMPKRGRRPKQPKQPPSLNQRERKPQPGKVYVKPPPVLVSR